MPDPTLPSRSYDLSADDVALIVMALAREAWRWQQVAAEAPGEVNQERAHKQANRCEALAERLSVPPC
jgi:hypothetical protein